MAAPDNFAVLVKTKRFNTVGDIPREMDFAQEVRGMVVNEVDPLSADEKHLLSQGFPGTDFSKVLILEENREPASPGKYLGFFGGGIALLLLGVGLLVGRKLVSRKPQVMPPATFNPIAQDPYRIPGSDKPGGTG